MIRHRYYIGTLTRDGLAVSVDAWSKIADALVDVYGGYTRYNEVGAWRDATGHVVREPSVIVEGISDLAPVIPAHFAKLLATIAEQSAVLWTEETIKGGFATC